MRFLYDKLKAYSDSDYLGFHMPGHKRKAMDFGDPFQIDITEIDGFDDLHHPEGILKEAQKRAAALYQAEESFFLVNGSTSGILSAISGTVSKRGKILIARNCHKSVYHAVFLSELEIYYTYPQTDKEFGISQGISARDVEKILNQKTEIQAVVITSPTYDGIVSDIEAIVSVCHRRGVPLIVDEAHGAHFGFHPYFPKSAVQMGADVVIQSLHKTLPSLTQTALLHLNGKLVNRDRIKRYLAMLQTSSPSYVLMASIDNCIEMLETKGEELFMIYSKNLERFCQSMKNQKYLRSAEINAGGVTDIFDIDRSRLLFTTAGKLSGRDLYQLLLKKYHIQMELCGGNYVLGISTVADDQEDFDRLYRALHEIDTSLSGAKRADLSHQVSVNEKAMEIHTAMEHPCEQIRIEEATGKISAEFIYIYPPGIPLLVPGEKISAGFLEEFDSYRNQELNIQGLEDYQNKKIKVLTDR